MPTTTWLGKIKSFLNPTIFTFLKKELDKKTTEESLEKITALMRTLFLKNESIPAHLFDAYPNTLIKVLKALAQETPFNKKTIYHKNTSTYLENTKLPGKVHCIKTNDSAIDARSIAQ